jgi:hypothetical protein
MNIEKVEKTVFYFSFSILKATVVEDFSTILAFYFNVCLGISFLRLYPAEVSSYRKLISLRHLICVILFKLISFQKGTIPEYLT